MSLLHISIKEILQKGKQLVKYSGNRDSVSPYSVTKETAIVLLPSRNVESYTETKPVTQSDSTINYGTFGKKSSFSKNQFGINNQFLTRIRLERIIEISQWSNITVVETITLFHTGAL